MFDVDMGANFKEFGRIGNDFGESLKQIGLNFKRGIDEMVVANNEYEKETKRLIDISNGVNNNSFVKQSREEIMNMFNLDGLKPKQDLFVSSLDQTMKNANSVVKNNASAFETSLLDSFSTPALNIIGYEKGTPPSQGALSQTPVYAKNFIEGYSDAMYDTSPYLNDTMSVVFTDATNIMKSIVHSSVEAVIADVNRALAKIRELNAAKSSSSSSSSSVTNKNNTFNINTGSSSSNLVSTIKRAVV
jgi:hypothetical protein